MKKSASMTAASIMLLVVIQTTTVFPMGRARYEKNGSIPNTDWSKAVVESTIKRFPTADSLKGWGYAKSLYLYGDFRCVSEGIFGLSRQESTE